MGNRFSRSSPPNPQVVCENCQKSTQKELPEDDQTTGDGQACAAIYERVVSCMDANRGQIAPCSDVWQSFKQCRENHGAR